jgi:hypothetical protein
MLLGPVQDRKTEAVRPAYTHMCCPARKITGSYGSRPSNHHACIVQRTVPALHWKYSVIKASLKDSPTSFLRGCIVASRGHGRQPEETVRSLHQPVLAATRGYRGAFVNSGKCVRGYRHCQMCNVRVYTMVAAMRNLACLAQFQPA